MEQKAQGAGGITTRGPGDAVGLSDVVHLKPQGRLEWRVAAIPVVLALGLNLLFFAAFRNHLQPDSLSYLVPAHTLVSAAAFNDAAGQPETVRTPGYPLFLAFFFALSLGVRTVVLVQHLILVSVVGATAVATYRVCGSRVAAVAAGIILALDLPSIETANTILTESVSTAFIFAVGYQAYRAATGDSRKALWHAAAAGLLGGWVVLIRPVALFYGVPLALFLFIAAKPGYRWKSAVVALLAFSLFPGFWIARNYRLTGHATVSSVAGINMLMYRAAGALAINDPGSFDANLVRRQDELQAVACQNLERTRSRPCSELSISDRASYYSNLGVSIILRNPGGYTREVLRGFGNVVLGGADAMLIARNMHVLRYMVPVAALALVGLLYWFRRDRAMLWLLLLTVGYFSVISAGAGRYSRFAAPFMVLALVGLLYWFRRDRAMLWLSLLTVGYFFVVSAGAGSYSRFAVPVAELALVGLLYWFRRDRAMFWLLLLTVGYFSVISAGADGYSRFRVPVMPLYAILAGGGTAMLSDRFRARGHPSP